MGVGRHDGGRRPPALAMTGPLRLGAGREFDLIRDILEQDARIHADVQSGVKPGGEVLSGAGGDCAVITAHAIAISTDASIENVHFRRDWMTPGEIGYRAAAAALSDLAPAAALPIGIFVTLVVRASDVPDWALEVMAGVSEAAAGCGARLLGGDVGRTDGPAMIDVTVTGDVLRAVTRGGARPGDALWVTGSLGAAGAAVRAWNAGTDVSPDAVRAFTRPKPRIAEALWLAERDLVRAAIDLSDGLAGDAGHLAAASGTRILLEQAMIPVADAVRSSVTDPADALALALRGGEDYELCFAASEAAIEPLLTEFEATFGVALTRVGRVVSGQGIALIGPDGHERSMPPGYDHFATD
jgi:thiamine-monophosphate kinase